MLIRFTVENYRSFHEPMTLDMTATRLTSPYPELDSGAVQDLSPRLRLLKAAAIYGANASGKSNLVKAVSVFKGIVQKSAAEMPPGPGLPYEPFRLLEGADRNPSQFEIELYHDGVRYRYGFAFDKERIHREWLYRTVRREAALFTRDGQNIAVHASFAEGREFIARTRPAALFLSVVALFNGALAQKVVGAINSINVISGLDDVPAGSFSLDVLRDRSWRDRIAQFVASMDTAVQALSIDERDVGELLANAPENVRALARLIKAEKAVRFMTAHRVRNGDGRTTGSWHFDLDEEESAGTAWLVMVAPPMLDTLDHGKTLVVDEFDARLHPRITKHVVRLFNSAQTNPRGAQLIVATHGVHLLARGTLRRDQVWFVEKDRLEQSRLYSLAEFKTRKQDVFDRQYLLGRYGAVPVLTGIEEAALGVAPA
jgi:energy-coupling factor transporter ATP-binding protein EcfA2